MSDFGKLPDLTDPATLGCLLELVREAWGDETFMPGQCTEDGWRFYTGSEAGDLVAALEAAP